MAHPILVGALSGMGRALQMREDEDAKVREEQRAANERRAQMDYQARQAEITRQSELAQKQSDPLYQAQLGAAQGAADYAQGRGPRWKAEQDNIAADNARADKAQEETTAARLKREAEEKDRQAKEAKAEAKRAEKEAKDEAKARAELTKAGQELEIRKQMLTSQYAAIQSAENPTQARIDLLKEVAKYPDLKSTWDSLEENKLATDLGPGARGTGLGGATSMVAAPSLGGLTSDTGGYMAPTPMAPGAPPPVPPPTTPPPADNQNVGGMPGAAPTRDPAQRMAIKAKAMAPPPAGKGLTEAQAEQWLTSNGW